MARTAYQRGFHDAKRRFVPQEDGNNYRTGYDRADRMMNKRDREVAAYLMKARELIDEFAKSVESGASWRTALPTEIKEHQRKLRLVLSKYRPNDPIRQLAEEFV